VHRIFNEQSRWRSRRAVLPLCYARSSRFDSAQSALDMADTADHPRSSQATLERRHHPRGKIDEVRYVDLLDGGNGGLALNISETGLLLQTALKVTEQELYRIRFQIPASPQWIEARARLVWVGESGKEAGVQFLALSEDVRAGIREWVENTGRPSFPPSSSPPDSVQENRDSPPLSFAQPGSVTRAPWRGLVKTACWAAVAVLAVLLGLRYSQWLRLTMLGGSKQAPSSLAGPPTNAVPSIAPYAQKGTDSILGSMLTQTLPTAPIATEPNVVGIRPQEQKQRQAKSLPEPSDTSSSAHADAPEPSHNTVLVGTPPFGAPPARLILESEPVNASSRVAVTARRSILVPGSHGPTKRLQLGKLVSYVDPVYPADALAKEVEGAVRVRAFIGRSGEVLSLRLLSGPEPLAPAAMRAIRQWRFAQTLLNGRAIQTQADVNVYFRPH
jgi:TonB family protein